MVEKINTLAQGLTTYGPNAIIAVLCVAVAYLFTQTQTLNDKMLEIQKETFLQLNQCANDTRQAIFENRQALNELTHAIRALNNGRTQ